MSESGFSLKTYPFTSFDELLGHQPKQGLEAWLPAQRTTKAWRQDCAHILQDSVAIEVPAGSGLKISLPKHSRDSFLFGIPPELQQGTIEKALHALLTTTLFCQQYDLEGIFRIATKQANAVMQYMMTHEHHLAYHIYAEQIADIIEGSRNAAICAILGHYPTQA